MPIKPYAMAFDGYDSTEDRCLATCLRDPVSFLSGFHWIVHTFCLFASIIPIFRGAELRSTVWSAAEKSSLVNFTKM